MTIDLDDFANDRKFGKLGRPKTAEHCKHFGQYWTEGKHKGELKCRTPGPKPIKGQGYCSTCYYRLLRRAQRKAKSPKQ